LKIYHGAITLAIGDGANDVSMLQSSHVGVGISGKEGRQAVLASDYAIGQFKFLRRLLLIHGHWNYTRVTKLILYSFYKNMVFVCCQFWFLLHCAWSGQTLFDSWSITLFNVAFTGLPIVTLAILDKDITEVTLLKYPQAYKDNQSGRWFTMTLFWLWMANAIYVSIVLFFGARYAFELGTINRDGTTYGLWEIGTLVYTLVVLTVNLKLAVETKYWTVYSHIGLWGSILVWFIWLTTYCALDFLPELSMYWIIYRLYATTLLWLALLLLPVVALLPDFCVQYYCSQYIPQNYQIIKEVEALEIAEEQPSPSNIIGSLVGLLKSGYSLSGFSFSQERGQRELLFSNLKRAATTTRVPIFLREKKNHRSQNSDMVPEDESKMNFNDTPETKRLLEK